MIVFSGGPWAIFSIKDKKISNKPRHRHAMPSIDAQLCAARSLLGCQKSPLAFLVLGALAHLQIRVPSSGLYPEIKTRCSTKGEQGGESHR
jgi:hypothetical protein